MALQTLNTIKDWFKTGLKPSQTQFWDTWDSFRHKNDKVPVAEVEGLDEIIDSKADKMILDNHLTDDAAHADLFNDKEDKTQKGAPDGYAPLDEFTKLAAQYLNIVNDLVTGGAESLLSAEQGKVLQMQVNAINNLLTSDNVNLDSLQELVDAVETVQASLSTILVNDLTTGGMTKALTAEMGKTLKSIIDSKASIAHSHTISEVTGLQSAINAKISKTESEFYVVGYSDIGEIRIVVSSNSSNLVIESYVLDESFIESVEFTTGFEPYDGKRYSITNKSGKQLVFNKSVFIGMNSFNNGDTYSFIYSNNGGSPIFIPSNTPPVLELDSQIEVFANTTVNPVWNKKTILFTANCTITVPATLLSQYGFVFRTLAGVTVTWAITAPFTWETTPSTTPEKTTGSFMRRGNTNTILLDF
ncbi:hypothetical protein [Flavobacterium polysaccharolyticum]|uniref:Uncharacterized protein n=1 Tax=Flavobacterium polysaccharolyticum TaxID=3133148 RepID=A0ABU9NLJ3_9FLAO